MDSFQRRTGGSPGQISFGTDCTPKQENYEKRYLLDYLYEQLQQVDPEGAAAIHPNNVKRVIRALEYYRNTGSKISEHNEASRAKESPYDFRYFVLNMDRAKLYERIDKRVDLMMEQGLLEEAKSLYPKRHLNALNTVGYKELFAYFDGQCTLAEAVEQIKIHTRQYAKRQMTWLRRDDSYTWIMPEEIDVVIQHFQT